MNIAIVVSAFPLVSETFILNQITGLIEQGHTVHIIAETDPHQAKRHPDLDTYGVMERVSYFPTIPSTRLMRWWQAGWLVLTNLHKDPLRILKTVNIRTYPLYLSIPFLGKRFDIVHCHFGPNGVLGMALKKLGFGGRYLTSFHGYDVNSYPQRMGADVYRELFAQGDWFTANTEFTKQQAVELGCPPEKISIIHESLRVEKFPFTERQVSPGGAIRLLTVGRLVEKKGHVYVLKALATVVKRYPQILYQIAGDGPLRSELETLTRELGIAQEVRFLGDVDEDEVVGLYQQAHLFVLASVTAADRDREGQALVLQEAQATGLPVLATFHNGIPEGVADGESGYLVPERDAEALATKLTDLIEHPQRWPEMGRNGRALVEKKFAAAVQNAELEALYHELIQT